MINFFYSLSLSEPYTATVRTLLAGHKLDPIIIYTSTTNRCFINLDFFLNNYYLDTASCILKPRLPVFYQPPPPPPRPSGYAGAASASSVERVCVCRAGPCQSAASPRRSRSYAACVVPGADPPLRIPCIVPGAKRSPAPLTIWRDAIHFMAIHSSAGDRGVGMPSCTPAGGEVELLILLVSPLSSPDPVGGLQVQDRAPQ